MKKKSKKKPVVKVFERAKCDVDRENKIALLVRLVRDNDCEMSFSHLKEYLSSYIKLFGKKYRIAGHDSDEIEQECLFALRYKAIEDFNPTRGNFKSFAILCIKRHLFSLIKGNGQQKRKVLNISISLDEDRSEDGESLSLVSLIAEDVTPFDEKIAKDETMFLEQQDLLSCLSPLEKSVYKFYIQRLHYDEIVVEVKKEFVNKNGRPIGKKSIDNALQRLRTKAQNLAKKR